MKKLRISRFEFGDPKSNIEVRQYINEGKSITRKFKKELNNNPNKKNNFTSYISNRFKNKSSKNEEYNNNDLVNASLMKQQRQQNIIKNKNNKHEFIELQHSNLSD